MQVDLVSLSEQLDTRTPAGLLMLTVLGALAQMEREQIAERTRVALHYKRDKGERLSLRTIKHGLTPPRVADFNQSVSAAREVARVTTPRNARSSPEDAFSVSQTVQEHRY